jgi:putative FmdB family regulatory protein
MPTYDYKCRRCGHKFEVFDKISAPPLRQCPVCNYNTAYKLIGAGIGLIFKGSGFYITDYKKKGLSDSEKKEEKTDDNLQKAKKS